MKVIKIVSLVISIFLFPSVSLSAESVYFFHNDHLGTPQEMTDMDQNVVWRAGKDPFGDGEVEVASIDNNLRFPGQYYDEETGLHYNWNRYYDPRTGRYITSDPIGLIGGINTFGYVDANPLKYIDPNGYAKTARPSPYSRINRRAEKIRRKMQSLRDRMKNTQDRMNNDINNLQNSGEQFRDEIDNFKDALDEVGDLNDELNRLDNYVSKECVEWDCPWDPDRNQCTGPAGPGMSPIRAPSSGCRCKREVFAD